MVEISNIPEKFFREIRQIEIFNAKEYSFTANSTGKSVSAEPKIIFKNIVPEDFDRSIKRKSKTETLFLRWIYHLTSMVSAQ